MKRILITGGAGFIGSNLTAKLLKDRENYVTCMDNFDPFYPRWMKERNILPFLNDPQYRLIEGDILEPNSLEKATDVDIIVHLAAKAGVRPSIKFPEAYQNVNVNGTLNLLEFARKRNIKQFIFASSSSVYGKNRNTPWNEQENLLPISPYASSKLSAEMLGHAYSHLYDIRFIALRFFTVYGPGQRPDLAIHRFFDSLLNDRPITVFGDGSSSRDYTYIDDIVNGICSAIDYSGSNFEIINLGNNFSVKLNELISVIEGISGKEAAINRLPHQEGDVFQTYADISKARNLLNYNPGITLQEGLKLFHSWFNNGLLCSHEFFVHTDS